MASLTVDVIKEVFQTSKDEMSRLIGRGVSSSRLQISVAQATSWSDLSACADLVVTEYAKATKKRPPLLEDTIENRLMVMSDYTHREQKVLCGKFEGKVVMTASRIFDNPERLLPMDAVFPEVGRFRERGGVEEIGWLAVDCEANLSKKAFEPLLSEVILGALAAGARHVVATVHPTHVPYYTRCVGFTALEGGQQREHPKVKKNPAVGLVLRMDDAHKHPYLRQNLLQNVLLLGY